MTVARRGPGRPDGDGQRRRLAGERATWILLAALVATPLLITVGGAWLAWHAVWRAAALTLRHTAEAEAEFGLRALSAHAVATGRLDALLRGLSDSEIRAREYELHLELHRVVEELPQAEAGFAIDRAGYLLVSTSVFPVPRDAPVAADRDFFLALRDSSADPDSAAVPGIHLSHVYAGWLDGEVFFAISRRRSLSGDAAGDVEGPPRAFAGLVNLSAYPNRLAEGLRRLAARREDVLALVREDGEILAQTLGQEGPTRIAPSTRFLEAVATKADRALYQASPAAGDGTPQLIALHRVEGWPVYAAALRPRAAILADWRRAVMAQLVVGVPASLALVGLAWAVRRGERRARRRECGSRAARHPAHGGTGRRARAESAPSSMGRPWARPVPFPPRAGCCGRMRASARSSGGRRRRCSMAEGMRLPELIRPEERAQFASNSTRRGPAGGRRLRGGAALPAAGWQHRLDLAPAPRAAERPRGGPPGNCCAA